MFVILSVLVFFFFSNIHPAPVVFVKQSPARRLPATTAIHLSFHSAQPPTYQQEEPLAGNELIIIPRGGDGPGGMERSLFKER